MTRRGRLFLALGLFALVLGIGLLQPTGLFAPIDDLGIRAATWLRRVPGSGAVTLVGVWLHWLGEPGGRLFVTLMLGFFLAQAGRSDEFLWLIAAVVGVMLINTLLKSAFEANRPVATFDYAIIPSGYSFPSGHAAGAMSLYGGIAMLARPRAIRLACLGMILATGASRVWLGVHWPSDVFAGWVEGAAWLVILSLILPARPENARRTTAGPPERR